ncbi:glycosyltransferase 87 family protein [Dictyobacter kobayashii]|uniref:DUF2029 domain-containing protein n=1 Tax=Dictyobacter kobayashii TaxID=2014872 RepID=A0A402AZ30_9CHLR|nr:glycosyltransferase 87 family protein [Dictyobacter kobayashii]GCE24369.1 hypothetical protein KDK_81690 [Dictyobacter kobayashii]
MEEMQRQLKTYGLIYLGVLIYLLFLISVAWTGWFNIFFSGAALHEGAKGIDFYQLPDGAWAFWHGGSLTGAALSDGSQYAQPNYANDNVYHVIFTLTLGSVLALFDPAQSPYIWLFCKAILSLLLVAYFVWSFRQHKHVGFAAFIILVNFSSYLELAAWQFHFVLNFFLLLFMILLVKRGSGIWIGVTYWLGMLVKPIGILLVPMLIFKGRWKLAAVGVGCFVLFSIIFLYQGIGKYYIDNLINNLSLSGTLGPNQIITLSALLHYMTHWPDFVYQGIQDCALLLVVFLGTLKRIALPKAVFLYMAYFLCFYEQVFEYQWSTLAYILAICVVTCPEFQTRRSMTCILLTCLPSCFIVLNWLHIDVQNMGNLGMIPGGTAWEWMVASKLLPLFLLLASVLVPDIPPIWKQLQAFWQAVRKVNARLGVFGDDLPASQPGVQIPLVVSGQRSGSLARSQALFWDYNVAEDVPTKLNEQPFTPLPSGTGEPEKIHPLNPPEAKIEGVEE